MPSDTGNYSTSEFLEDEKDKKSTVACSPNTYDQKKALWDFMIIDEPGEDSTSFIAFLNIIV